MKRSKFTDEQIKDAERALIAEALQKTRGVVGGWDGAATRLGVSRTTRIAKMQKLGLANSTKHGVGRQRLSDYDSGSI